MKPGYQTSEFLLAVVTAVAAVVLCLAGKIDGDVAMGAVTVATAGYSISRGTAKKNPPKKPTTKTKVD